MLPGPTPHGPSEVPGALTQRLASRPGADGCGRGVGYGPIFRPGGLHHALLSQTGFPLRLTSTTYRGFCTPRPMSRVRTRWAYAVIGTVGANELTFTANPMPLEGLAFRSRSAIRSGVTDPEVVPASR